MLPMIDQRHLSRHQVWGAGERAGYAHELYSESLAEFGSVIMLEHAGASLLKRRIPNSANYDCVGCYPLFVCERVECLCTDFELLTKDIVSVGVVIDPWSGGDEASLVDSFEIVKPFKIHYLVDLEI